MTLVQIQKRTGRIDRVRREHAPPVIEIDLEPNQYIVGVELREDVLFHSERVTSDWEWTAYVASTLA